MRRTVAVNDRGHVIGEMHPKARLTDREVDLIRNLHDEGLSLVSIADKFETTKGHVHDLCSGRRRGQTAMGYRTLRAAPRYRFRPAHPDEFEVCA